MSVTLVLAAIVAGLATFLSPCALPHHPGRARDLDDAAAAAARSAIALGLALAFVAFTLAASRVLSALGLPQDLLHTIAVALLAFAGLLLLAPFLAEWAGRLFQPLAARGERRACRSATASDRDSRWERRWPSCGRPAPGPSSPRSRRWPRSATSRASLVLITIAYAAGATVPLFVLVLLGRRAVSGFERVRRHGPALRRASGVVLLVGAWLFTTNLPTRLAAATPGYLSWIQSPSGRRPCSSDLRSLDTSKAHSKAGVAAGSDARPAQGLRPAPDFAGISAWINTPGSQPLTLRALRGKVVLVDFWTYSCVNCIRTLPYLEAWYGRYAKAGFVIVGVHTPEFAFEHVVGNVRRAVGEHDIRYPVAVDDDYKTWNAYANQYWPADYLIDRNGHVRDVHFGEGAYARDRGRHPHAARRAGIRAARGAARGDQRLRRRADARDLPRHRARALLPDGARGRLFNYTPQGTAYVNDVELVGNWRVEKQRIVAGRGAHLLFSYVAPRIYVVAAPPARAPGAITATVDGTVRAPIGVAHDDLYQLAHLATPGRMRSTWPCARARACTRSRSDERAAPARARGPVDRAFRSA